MAGLWLGAVLRDTEEGTQWFKVCPPFLFIQDTRRSGTEGGPRLLEEITQSGSPKATLTLASSADPLGFGPSPAWEKELQEHQVGGKGGRLRKK